MPIVIDALLTGRIMPFARGESSAIDKRVVEGPVTIGFFGIVGDQQADSRYHGGVGKALHHYPRDHYEHWAKALPDQPLLSNAGAFGENISTSGLVETHVCIGDRFRAGSAIIEVSQGRQPCWKQGVRLEWSALPAQMVKERRSGWYYRVIEPGSAQAGEDIELLDRPLPEWSVARVFGLLIAGDHKHDKVALTELAAMDLLDISWRNRARELVQ